MAPGKPLSVNLFFFVLLFLLQSLLVLFNAQAGQTVEEQYPGLASDSLKSADLARLPKGTLLTSGSLIIKESDLTREINRSDPALRKQLIRNAFYLLEKMATKQLVLQEAYKAGYKKESAEDQTITKFLSEKVKPGTISDEELKNFYTQNKGMIGSASFEETRDLLKHLLTQQKIQEAQRHYVQTLFQQASIQLNEDWVKKQSILSRDNPVDQARMSGKPSLIDFGATGCGPCDMMTPILADLEKRYKDKLNVLFVHVNQEVILSARFGIKYVPVQVFFDKNGREVFRHTGFFPQTDIEKKLIQFGL
ncbi:MAG: thioredoxin family protein, partial [Thermodesulfobacteriota bacterium]